MAVMTKKMLSAEKILGKPLIVALPEMITNQGLSASAEELGVSKATLGYWMLKLDIIVKRVALAPGESITINRAGKDYKDRQQRQQSVVHYGAD